MRRALLDKYVDLLSQADVMLAVRESPGRHVAFLGAGVSREAQVPLASEICEDIRRRLLTGRDVDDSERWAREHLSWTDSRRRYMACLNAYGPAAQRVTYFRQLLKDTRPSFAHHAIALLMTRGVLFETALTTNFDKLLEKAFLEQGSRECQAIRTEEEGEYWVQESDKCYVFKLHGDYDTHNILNTQPETRSVPGFFVPHCLSSLRGKGLLVLGSAAHEESIVEFVKRLSLSDDRPVLSGGIRWGVYVGPRRPEGLSSNDELKQLQVAIESGAVSRQVIELLSDVHDEFGDRRPCSFFPVWGTGNFLLSLINTCEDAELMQSARLLLDHDMRLHAIFRAQRLNPEVIEKHIENLEKAQRKVGADTRAPARPLADAFRAESTDAGTKILVAYGDVTNPSGARWAALDGTRRAIVSPEDTTISAGGGVALRLLTKAGPRQLLNELSKLSPISHGTCAVTSGGDLPFQYLIHAAALQIGQNGEYNIGPESIRSAIADSIRLADSLGVAELWIPLLGTGVANVPADQSLAAILGAIVSSDTQSSNRTITVAIFQESILGRDSVRVVLAASLPPHYRVTEV